jgi:hypothetical protein
LLRVTEGGNVQVVEYFSTDRDGPPAHYHPWPEASRLPTGTACTLETIRCRLGFHRRQGRAGRVLHGLS